MGKGQIISEIGDGKYKVQMIYEGRDRLQNRLDKYDATIAALTAQISDLEDQQEELTLPDDLEQWQKLQIQIDLANLKKLAAEKNKAFYEDNFPDDPILDLWCIDRTEGLTGDVGLAEINGELVDVLIRPGYNNQAVYDADRDGQVMPAIGGSAFQVLFNWMIFPGWQKWKPTYRIGKIISGSMDYAGNKCSVCLIPAFSSQLNLGINQDADFGGCDSSAHSGWNQFCSDNPTHPACTNTEEKNPLTITPEMWDQIVGIQELVNSEHDYAYDQSGKEVGDHWQIMGEGEAGDCEDFALTKLDELINAGFHPGNLSITTCFTESGGYHAVLMIRTNNMGNLILDNRYDTVMNQDRLSYSWHLYQKAGSSWAQFASFLEEVPIQYMDCNAGAFADNDIVIIEFQGQDWDDPKLIGFYENPEYCTADMFANGFYYYFKYTGETDIWSYYAENPRLRHDEAFVETVIFGQLIFCCGGYEEAQLMSPVDKTHIKFDIDAHSYSTVLDMITGRGYQASFGIDYKEYVTGGLKGSVTLPEGAWAKNTVEAYDITQNTWATRNSLPNGRELHWATSTGGYGYNGGGIDGQVITEPEAFVDDAEKYNPSGNSWSGFSVSYNMYTLHAMDITGKVYCVCGFSETSQTPSDTLFQAQYKINYGEWNEETIWFDFAYMSYGHQGYNPETNSWFAAAIWPSNESLVHRQGNAGANGIGYQLGEYNYGDYSSGYMAKYTPTTDSWQGGLDYNLPPSTTLGLTFSSCVAQ